MNKQSHPVHAATMLMAASALLFVACGGHNSALDARATVPGNTDAQQSTPDPALNNLEAVTHHG